MKTRRQIVPRAVADEILFRNKHVCCICREPGRDVVIHHIDGNPSNNGPGNLAVVCHDCHSRVTGARGLGRAYTPSEVRKYKRSSERQVLESRRVHRPIVRYKKEVVSRIDFLICEILACEKNPNRAKELLELLYELHVWRGDREIDARIISGLHHLAVMTGLGSPTLATMVSEKLWQMCWQFVGPGDVPMTKRDLATVLECIDALETLATFNCEFGHGRKATESFIEQAQNFFEVGLWYSNRRIPNAVIRLYDKALKACYQDGRLSFRLGRTRLRRATRKLMAMLREEKPAWRYQAGKVAGILQRGQ